jgi:formamidopyrimidine-DNA glycosylase
MPEGGECRRFAENLAHRVSGQTIQSIEILSGRYKENPPEGYEEFQASLPIKVVGTGVHGKFIYWILDSEFNIWSTLGMTGAWRAQPGKHSRVKFTLSNGDVYYDDMRNFGTLKFANNRHALLNKLKTLGPDMLAEDIDEIEFIDIMRKHNKKNITKVMMNQSVIAGVGNYVKAESLYIARISPMRNIADISDDELRRLCQSIKLVLRESYKSGGATIQTYANFNGEIGEYSQRFCVYNQKTDPDGNLVQKDKTPDGRTTHWVPKVQI